MMNNRIDYHPIIWGNSAWKFLHTVADGYPDFPTEDDKKYYTNFFKSLEYTLPCNDCRKNYGIHLKETPIENYLKTSYTLSEWVSIMHNKVNLMLGKKMQIHEKTRRNRVVHNNKINNGKACCGQQKGLMTEEQRIKNIEDLEKSIRAKKTFFEKVKEKKNKRKAHRQ